MSDRFIFTEAQDRLVRMLIADECPSGEIADTVGCSRGVLVKSYPEAKGTKAQIKAWLAVFSFVRETEQKYFNPRTGLPELQRGRDYELEQKRRAEAEKARARRTSGPVREPVDAELLREARRLLAAGESYRKAAEATGLSTYVLKTRLPGMGHPSKRYRAREVA